LTVPFARYIATHSIDNIKRYHIARVYRRDNPAMQRGRFREFYQCDFDIAGVYTPLVPDAECLKVLTEILDALPIGTYKVKLNHRKILDGLMTVCGVPADKIRTISSAIDKLDKEPWEAVKAEMLQKGLTEQVADKLGVYVLINGAPFEVLDKLKAEPSFATHDVMGEGIKELDVLFGYLQAMGALPNISFDLSLARGLDYYTGVIYEAIQTSGSKVGSIAAGGRYDNLVGTFHSKPVPAVGVSIGIERILAMLEEMEAAKGKIRKNITQVLVGSIGNNLLSARMSLANQLWSAGIATEFLYDVNPKPKKQLDHALENQIPYVIWIGEEEEKQGVYKFKNLDKKEEQVVSKTDIVNAVQKAIAESSSSSSSSSSS
jgi:histidyl-tRNA synthetase